MRNRLSGLVPGARSRRQLVEARREIDRLRARVHRLELTGRPRLPVRDDLRAVGVDAARRGSSTRSPATSIRGENRQVLLHVYRFHRTAVKQRALHRRAQRQRDEPLGGLTATKAWYGMDNFACPGVVARRPQAGAGHPPAARAGHPRHRLQGDPLDQRRRRRSTSPGCARSSPARGSWSTPATSHAVAQSKWWAETPNAYDHLASGRSASCSWPRGWATPRSTCTTTTTSTIRGTQAPVRLARGGVRREPDPRGHGRAALVLTATPGGDSGELVG